MKNEKIIEIYNQIVLLHDVAQMLVDSNFKSAEAKGFNAGQEFAYKNVMKLIENKIMV